MEIKVVGKDVSGMGLCPEIATVRTLKIAFEYKSFRDAVADIFGFETHIILQTARRTVEVRKEHPRYRVAVDGNSCDVITDNFDLAMSRCMLFWEDNRKAVLERWREYGNGVKRWEQVG